MVVILGVWKIVVVPSICDIISTYYLCVERPAAKFLLTLMVEVEVTVIEGSCLLIVLVTGAGVSISKQSQALEMPFRPYVLEKVPKHSGV